MAEWKYQNKTRQSAEYVRFEEGVAKTLTVTEWDFPKGAPYLFRCYVTLEDGNSVDKLWTVWDGATSRALKKKLGVKANAPRELTVTMHTDDEDEHSFDIA
jgi:hypothetical protein